MATGIKQPTIIFVNGSDGCHAMEGKRPDYRLLAVNLDETVCRERRSYFHELFHVLGLQHTHTRPDRDDYIRFYEKRTAADWLDQYEKMTEDNSYGVPYDFDSVMHYIPDGTDTLKHEENMKAKNELYQFAMGRNVYGAAHSDYLQLNRLYNCFDKCMSVKTTCANGGFVNPNSCQECICPRGFAGASCEDLDYDESVQHRCGGYEYATDSWKDLDMELSANVDNITCYWFLKASQGKRIEIKLVKVAPENQRCTPDTNTWLEVRLGTFEIGGYKFYCQQQLPERTLTSGDNLAVVTLSQDYDDATQLKLIDGSDVLKKTTMRIVESDGNDNKSISIGSCAKE
ncbi:hypothetical protein QR680_015923 [Steinernema hermaphroditum]|uniref:Metalloendopeptidase n=1 Tax=Steinernema hermaphroditum TaxID=289476 RepID=A0AA39HBZ0_9BILA|nr:hypothetical protein QR680_015923 [Steinernema hermaphroditum]